MLRKTVKQEIFTKKEYLRWIKTRSADVAKWDLQDCRKADAYIKKQALNNLNKLLKKSNIHLAIQEFLITIVNYHYGTEEVDDLLMELDLYPKGALSMRYE